MRKLSSLPFVLILLSAFTLTSSIQETKARVFNFHNPEELEVFEAMNLDERHPNLLDPSVSKEEINTVIKSWTELHQQIGKFMTVKEFDWGVEKGTVSMFQKIYFNEKGEIENYFFNVRNPNIPFEKKEEFADLLQDFSAQYSIDLKRDTPFAQCGKTRY